MQIYKLVGLIELRSI